MHKILLLLVALACAALVGPLGAVAARAEGTQPWYKSWNAFPDVPKMEQPAVEQLLRTNTPVIFIYAGYKVPELVCGTLLLTYTAVPPESDGSTVRFKAPKDAWVLVYCT